MHIGFALCGSFCTFAKVIPIMELLARDYEITPIMSTTAANTDTRFGTAADHRKQIEYICGKKPYTTISEVEPIGPEKMFDALIVAPCTGNTIAKLAHSIADGPVTMAAKSHMRNGRPILIGISTNDALAGSAENIGKLLAKRNYYFIPFGQDEPFEKPTSIVADFTAIPQALEMALNDKQIQPILL